MPLALGLRAAWRAWRAWRERHGQRDPGGHDPAQARDGPGVWSVAAVTFANGGDNIGVYVPVFTETGPAGTAVFITVFLVLVAAWCAAGRWFATRRPIAAALVRWGHVILPVVLIGIGLVILVEGGAFGL